MPAASDTGFSCRLDFGTQPLVTEVDGVPVIRTGPRPGRDQWEAFGCNPQRLNPDTPDRVPSDVRLVRKVHTGGEVTFHDGQTVRFWGFEDPEDDSPGADSPYPSPLIRVREGQIVHVELDSRKNSHTLHLHGIEPTPHNDGVGHTSFEVTGSYTYQWRASEAGSYAYHCHKNTALHFEMGMFGALVIDPPQGPGFTFVADELVPYDHERIWVIDDVDPVWHEFGHQHGVDCGVMTVGSGLNVFHPEYFLVSGVPSHLTEHDPRVAVEMDRGEVLLARLNNASYSVLDVRLGLDSLVTATDGHSLGRHPVGAYGHPVLLPAGEVISMTTARRVDLLLHPELPGTYPVEVRFRNWVQGTIVGALRTFITVR